MSLQGADLGFHHNHFNDDTAQKLRCFLSNLAKAVLPIEGLRCQAALKNPYLQTFRLSEDANGGHQQLRTKSKPVALWQDIKAPQICSSAALGDDDASLNSPL